MATTTLLIELGAVMFGLGLLGAVSLRFSISPIPLYLLAGLALGTGGLLPLTTSHEFISTGAEIGVILLLFSLGLEYTADELIGTLRSSAVAGLLDLALNAAPGALICLMLGWGPVAAIAMAGVTYGTSSGITAKIINDLGWLGNRETPAVLSLLVFEDLTMAIYLPVLTIVLAGVSPALALATLATSTTTIGVIFLVVLRHGHMVERLVAGPNDEVTVLKVLGLTLLVAGIAQSLRASAAVGAFLLGIALSGPLAHEAGELLAPLRDLFAAVFFVFFGLRVDPATLLPVLGIAVLLAFTGIITKAATGWIAAAKVGSATTGRLRAASALIPRGEFNIVVAGLAVAAGVHPQLGAVATAYVLILAIAGPVLARSAEPLARVIIRSRRQWRGRGTGGVAHLHIKGSAS